MELAPRAAQALVDAPKDEDPRVSPAAALAGDGRGAVHAVRGAGLHLGEQLAGAQRRDHLHDAQRVEQLVERAVFAERPQQGYEALHRRHGHHPEGAERDAAHIGAQPGCAKPALVLRDPFDHRAAPYFVSIAGFNRDERAGDSEDVPATTGVPSQKFAISLCRGVCHGCCIRDGRGCIVDTSNTNDQIPAGSLIGGKYRVRRLLGKGGMGAVYEAENSWTERRVAIKILLPEFAAKPDVVQRFLREAKATTQLAHPNIVDVLDMGQEGDGGPLYVPV